MQISYKHPKKLPQAAGTKKTLRKDLDAKKIKHTRLIRKYFKRTLQNQAVLDTSVKIQNKAKQYFFNGFAHKIYQRIMFCLLVFILKKGENTI